MSLISVIVPVYKAVATLARCVDSVLRQSFSDWQLILVDDGSPDESGTLCDSFAARDSRIHVIHKLNGGVSTARNAGLDAARGEWVIFLDADDCLSPFALDSAIQAQQSNPDTLVLWPAAYSMKELPQKPDPAGSKMAPDQLARLQLINCLPMPWNKLFRLSLIRQQNLHFDPAYTLGEDLLFCLDYCLAMQSENTHGFFLLKSPLTYYEQDVSESLTHRLRTDYYPLWQAIYDRLFQVCCSPFACSEADMAELRRAALQTITAGACDLLIRSPESPVRRRQSVKAVLRDPWLLRQVRLMKQGGQFSLYEPAICLASPRLLLRIYRLRCEHISRFMNLQYLGQGVRLRLQRFGRRHG